MYSSQKFKIINIILNKCLFDDNIIHIILKYYWKLLDKRKVLLEWIPINKLDCDMLSLNLNAINFLEENEDKINWRYLSENPNAIKLLENNKNEHNSSLYI